MRTVRVVVGTRRNELDRIAAEDGQVADVLLPLGQVPGIVGIRFGPIAKLMTANRHGRRGRHLQRSRQHDPIARHLEGAKQFPNAEENTARIVAGNENHRASILCRLRPDAKPLGRELLIIDVQIRCKFADEPG